MLMPTKILVPTDFSEYSDSALGHALDIAGDYGARVYVVHVVHKEIFCIDESYDLSAETIQAIKDIYETKFPQQIISVDDYRLAVARKKLQERLDNFPQVKEVETATNIRKGTPYEEILKEGKEKKIDLIVIASLGRSGIAKYFIGSVARNVLKGSKCPVLLVKASPVGVPILRPTKIMVPTDFSEYSDKALRQALDIGRQYKAKVHVCHVVHHEHIHRRLYDVSFDDETVQQLENQTIEAAEENLVKQVAKFYREKDVEVSASVKIGLPYEAIVEEAKEKGVDLIVIASLGRSGIAKYFIGNVARNVLKGAMCPVLLTK